MKPVLRLVRSVMRWLIRRPRRVTLSLRDGSLSRVLRDLWPTLQPGAEFAFQTRDAAHEVCAVVTTQGWLLRDIERPEGGELSTFHLHKPEQGRLIPHEPDWPVECQHWRVKIAESAQRADLPKAQRLNGARERRCHVIGVGIAKSGTRSLAGLFSRYHSAHEFEAAQTIQRITERRETLTADWLQKRDQRSGFLECDSSQLHYWYLADLVRAFPDARFILTIREPRAWLDSLINHRLARGLPPDWAALEELRFGPPSENWSGPERLLALHGRPSLDSVFSFWAQHHQAVLDTVPPERLLVLRVQQISTESSRIARFAGVPPETLSPAAAHLNPGHARFDLLERLPAGYLESKIDEHCTSLWQQMIARADDKMVAV